MDENIRRGWSFSPPLLAVRLWYVRKGLSDPPLRWCRRREAPPLLSPRRACFPQSSSSPFEIIPSRVSPHFPQTIQRSGSPRSFLFGISPVHGHWVFLDASSRGCFSRHSFPLFSFPSAGCSVAGPLSFVFFSRWPRWTSGWPILNIPSQGFGFLRRVGYGDAATARLVFPLRLPPFFFRPGQGTGQLMVFALFSFAGQRRARLTRSPLPRLSLSLLCLRVCFDPPPPASPAA